MTVKIVPNIPIEKEVSPRTKVTNFTNIQKRKTAHGIIVGLNQKFKRDLTKDTNTSYTARELSILFGEKVTELNLERKKRPQEELKYIEIKEKGERCPICGQKKRMSFKVKLSKNLIRVLWDIYKTKKCGDYIKTKEIFKLPSINTSSGSAILTRLKYLGLIHPYFDSVDFERESVRSGKWIITKAGINFLKRHTAVPCSVIVKNERVMELGETVLIDDPAIKWEDGEDIWKELKEHWGNSDYD